VKRRVCLCNYWIIVAFGGCAFCKNRAPRRRAKKKGGKK
jgi:hypothetical protein